MFYGYPATGKSTIAKLLKKEFDRLNLRCILIRTCDIRKKEKTFAFPSPEYFNEKIVKNRKERDALYKKFIKKAEEELKQNNIIILDSTFSKIKRRKLVKDLTKKFHTLLIILWCGCKKESKIKQRLKKRWIKSKNPSDSFQVYKYIKEQADKIEDYELKEKREKIIKIDTDNNRIYLFNCDKEEDMIKKIINQIKSFLKS